MTANLDVVRSIFARWEQGDWQESAWADPEIEFVIADGPDQRSITGTEAMARTWRGFLTAWTDYAITAEEIRELDGDRVYVRLRASGRGKASGAQIGLEQGANIFHIHEGTVRRLAIYFNYRNALDELGLVE